MRYFTILFDFDGTLADSQELGLRVLNAVAPEFNFKPIAPEEIPALKKMSARQLLVGRAGIPLWNIFKIRRLDRRVREEFRKHAEELQVFEGVPHMMKELRNAGYEIGIVTSNAHDLVADVIARAGIEVDFIHGGSTLFGKARAIRGVLRAYEIDRPRTVYVGDELRDIEACKKVGIDMIAVGWGFNSPEALRKTGVQVVSNSGELSKLFLSSV